MRVVFERRRAEQEHVPAESRDRRDRAIRRVAASSRGPAEPLGFVDDEQIDVRGDRLLGQVRPLDQRLERNHRAAMHVERVEALTEVARHVGEARCVEQREHLVVLAPQLAEPLHGQRIGRDHQAALDPLRVQQAVHDQRRFDGLAQPDLVGQQPPHRQPCSGAFGDVELMWEQPHASAEHRSEAISFFARQSPGESGARRHQLQGIEPRQEGVGRVDVARGQACDQGTVARGGRRRCRHEGVAVGSQTQRRAAVGKVDDEYPAVDRGDAAGAEFGVEAVGELVPRGPRMHALILPLADVRSHGGPGHRGVVPPATAQWHHTARGWSAPAARLESLPCRRWCT